MSRVNAKFRVASVRHDASGTKVARLEACTSGSEENKEWSKWTPAGTVEIYITNDPAAEFFVPGGEVYLQFSKEPFM